MQKEKVVFKAMMIAVLVLIAFVTLLYVYLKGKNSEDVKVWDQKSVLVSFVDDDATESLTKDYYPILEARNIKGNAAAIMGTQNIKGFATQNQLLELQEKGWDILNHSCDINSLKAEDADKKLKYSREIAKESGFVAAKKIFVYPNGYTANEIKVSVSNYFNYALGVQPFSNTLPLNRLEINRLFLTNGEEENKKQIEKMMEKPGWIIISTHSNKFNADEFAQLVDYILEKDCKIVTVSEAIQMIEASNS